MLSPIPPPLPQILVWRKHRKRRNAYLFKQLFNVAFAHVHRQVAHIDACVAAGTVRQVVGIAQKQRNDETTEEQTVHGDEETTKPKRWAGRQDR